MASRQPGLHFRREPTRVDDAVIPMPRAFWVPTGEECRIIRRTAANEYQRGGSVLLEPGIRFNTEQDGRPRSINIRLVSDHPDWDDTDLDDYAPWDAFRKGVELRDGNDALVDFYVRELGDRELLGNVQAEFDSRGLVAVYADKPAPLWRRAE
jgi:hypothetical protein